MGGADQEDQGPRLTSWSGGGGGLDPPRPDGLGGGGIHGGGAALRHGGHRHRARPHLPPPALLRRANLPVIHRPHHLHGPDPDLNPFMDVQAQSRAHRIGQTRLVIVYQLITKCSVEEKILKKSKQKLAIENMLMDSSKIPLIYSK